MLKSNVYCNAQNIIHFYVFLVYVDWNIDITSFYILTVFLTAFAPYHYPAQFLLLILVLLILLIPLSPSPLLLLLLLLY